EPAREVPVVQRCDVLVCGGGPAGVAAAVAAARAGAKTYLLELHGCIGGVWTSGALSWILDPADKPGIMREIIAELEGRAEGTWRPGDKFAADPEVMKLVLEEMCLAAGVSVQLHTRVVAAARNAQNRLAVAITESKSGRQAWAAEVFVDTTGDGDLAAQAGCAFDVGHPESGECQPMSLIAVLTGLRSDEVRQYTTHERGKPLLLEAMGRVGVSPSYSAPTLICVRDGLFLLMANHEYGVSATSADQITRATLRARAEVHQMVAGLRALGGVWRDVQLVSTGAQIGVREGRRIHGRYTVSTADLLSGARHEDAVCRVTFPVDVHSTNPQRGRSGEAINRTLRSQPYDIPLRALIARDVDGLILAGRCISGDFIAHSSYRVTGNAVTMGQAAGTTAALAAGSGRLPHEVPWPEVRASLERLESTTRRVPVGVA
ncbi:MAG: FAD-dependent oxidoreductase, partial [Chloroflexota bacterium]|nr:FAD-dependent oxidoreductase [Chloroflexota bacterium]